MTLLLLLTAENTGGNYVVTLLGFSPSARFDGHPWTRIRVEEAAAKTGPWTELVTANLSPADADPAEPAARDITVAGATLPVGWYRVTFLDANGNLQPTTPVYSGSGWVPTTRDVATVLRARLFSQGGRAPDFLNVDDEGGPTDPTRDEVMEMISDAVSDIGSKVSLVLPEDAGPIARRVAALGAALLVELGSEDFDQDRYDRLAKLYDQRLAQLLDAAQDEAEGGQVGDADDRAEPSGVASFPAGGTHWDWERF